MKETIEIWFFVLWPMLGAVFYLVSAWLLAKGFIPWSERDVIPFACAFWPLSFVAAPVILVFWGLMTLHDKIYEMSR